MTEAGYAPEASTTIYQDNQGTIALAKNVMTSRRAKYIDIRHHFVREMILNGDINVQYCPTHEMNADLLTKPLGAIVFSRFRGMFSSGGVEGCESIPHDNDSIPLSHE